METGFDLKLFGQKLSALCEKHALKLFDLALESEVDLGELESIAQGKQAPTVNQVVRFARVLKVSTEYLLGLSNEPSEFKQMPSESAAENTDDLDKVIENEMGWHARGFIPPNSREKEILRAGFKFKPGMPRERVQFYWDVLPWILSRMRTMQLLGDPEF